MAEPRASDVVLLARIQAGDADALTEVYRAHAPTVFGLSRRVTCDEQIARDITQEVFAYLWELPHRVDLTRGSLLAFVCVIAHRRAVDEVRRNERRRRSETALGAAEFDDSPETGVLDSDARAWAARQVVAALDQLPAEQRVAVMLAYYSGHSYRQVAQELGIPEGTAKSRLRLALARLRGLLDDEVMGALR